MLIETEFNCLGYYGFGSGVMFSRELTKADRESAQPKMAAYCQGCTMKDACWQIHRERVQKFVPDLAKFIDDLGKEPNGSEKIVAFIKENGTKPYMSIMMGNMEDGAFVVSTGKPKDRQEMTLPYPFK